jgi:hypothetical protein
VRRSSFFEPVERVALSVQQDATTKRAPNEEMTMTKHSVHAPSLARPFACALLSLTTLAFGCSDGGGSGAEPVAETSSALTTATNPDPVNLVYRDDFAVDAMTFDPATGMLTQHFAGKLYLPTLIGQNQLVSIGGPTSDDSTQAKVAVDGTWYIDPSAVAGVDPSAPPPIMQMRPDAASSHVRFTFDDGSVLEMQHSSRPLLSANFTLGSSIAAAGSSLHYDFFFTETCALLKETAGKGRYAGMVGTYTFHQGVTVVGPNLQVHSRGIAMLTLKNAP